MGIERLDNPLRITWDLASPARDMPVQVIDEVLEKVLAARVFFVTLEQTPLLHPKCGDIVECLSDAGVVLLLLCSGSDSELGRLASLGRPEMPVLLRLEPFIADGAVDYPGVERTLAALRGMGHDPGLSLVPTPRNIPHIAPLLRFSRQLAVPRFKLPNVRIDDNFLQSGHGQILKPSDLDILRAGLDGSPFESGTMELEIHDLFLWEILTPGKDASRSEYGGCQAGNSLAHVRSDGFVLPCMSWPVPLGSLLEQDFAEIWSSEPRENILEMIAVKPRGCTGCSDYPICFGGCRGLAASLETPGGLDPLCNGPR